MGGGRAPAPPGAAPPRFDAVRGRDTLRAVMIALPLALAAFWLFPRLSTPLWGMPENALGQGGLDERMTPDQWVDLFADDSPALRVRFLDSAPPPRQMYWRAQVLWNFDGQTWTREFSTYSRAAPVPRARSAELRYEVAMEPTDRRYLVVLDTPLEAPDGGRLTSDASEAEVERAYRRLIAQYHPDRLGGVAPEIRQQAEDKAREINAAYERIQKQRRK